MLHVRLYTHCKSPIGTPVILSRSLRLLTYNIDDEMKYMDQTKYLMYNQY